MYEYEYEEEQMFMPEVNVLERVQYEVPSASRSEMQNDPVLRFKVQTNAVAMNMKNMQLGITDDDVAAINASAQSVRNPQFKSPVGFVLGYYITKNGGGEINRSNLDNVKINLATISAAVNDSKLLKLEDIIRYGRLFITQL